MMELIIEQGGVVKTTLVTYNTTKLSEIKAQCVEFLKLHTDIQLEYKNKLLLDYTLTLEQFGLKPPSEKLNLTLVHVFF